MTTLDRYVLREWAKVFFLATFGFPLLVFVIDLVDNLDKYLARGVSKQHLALSYLYYVPETVTLVFPVAVLFAVVFTVGALGRHAELTAAKASGISFHRPVRPLLVASLDARLDAQQGNAALPARPGPRDGVHVRLVAHAGPPGRARRAARRAEGARRDALRRAGALHRRAGALGLGYQEAARGARPEAVGAVRVHHHRAVRRAARDLDAAQRRRLGRGGVPRHNLRRSADVPAVQGGGRGRRAAAQLRRVGAELRLRRGGGVGGGKRAGGSAGPRGNRLGGG